MIDNIDNIFNLNKRVVVITGAAGLLGRNHAKAVAAFNGIPVLIDINEKGLQDLSDVLNNDFSCKADYYTLDITDEGALINCCKEISKKHNKIDGLVLNAANNPKVEELSEKNFSRLENFPLEDWLQDIKVGLTGSFLCAKHFGKQISLNPKGGSIVIISSDLGLIAPDQSLYKKEGLEEDLQNVKPVSYSVVKTGVIGLMRYISSYWSDRNIRCNAICPGGVKNNQPEDFLNEIATRIPLGRMANQNEYQGVLIWMLSDASSYLNGAVIPVDGGRSAI